MVDLHDPTQGQCEAKIFRGFNQTGNFPLHNIGDSAETKLRVRVPAIEVGGKATVVNRTLRLERE